MRDVNIGLIGNPNCGKTTLFNAYTGARLKVANWPGVTVEKKEGSMCYHDCNIKLVDLPGVYSLASYTMEEKVAREYIMGNEVDVIVDIADASSLERNLYLTLQLIEIGKPVVLVLNMMDIVKERGMKIDTSKLSQSLGVPVVPVSAKKKAGLEELLGAVLEQAKGKKRRSFQETGSSISHNEFSIKKNCESEKINEKYDLIEKILEKTIINRAQKAALTDAADKVLTNEYLGLPVFLMIMACVFFVTFAVGDYLKTGFEWAINSCSVAVRQGLVLANASDFVVSLVVDGILAGVGGILTFLPNICILFLALGILEDSGYMSRVAYVMDGIMGKLGLSGRAFIPMMLGFGCTVPAIMASRTLEDNRDRFRTILVTPFMSCSARLPIYVLFSQMFFGKYAMFAAFSMYLVGLLTAILVARIMMKIGKKKEINPLLIELPEYKMPNGRTIAIYVWEKVKDYLVKAGTTIFFASILVWFLLNFNPNGMTDDISNSFGAMLGVWLVPLLKPAGLGNWQIALSLISGLSAKEVVVSSFCVLYHITDVNSQTGMQALQASLFQQGFTAVNAYAMMLFCLLYTPCIASLATIHRELKSRKWMVFVIIFQVVTAWTVTTLFYQIASLF